MMKLFRLLPVFVVLFLLAGFSSAEAAGIVTLKPASEVQGGSIRLSDVFNGVPKEIDRAIAIAPDPGKSVTYDARILARLADQYRLDWQPKDFTEHTVLFRAATKITQDMIRRAVLAKLSSPDFKSKILGKAEVSFDNRALELNLPADRSPDFTLQAFDYDPVGKRFHALLAATGGNETLPLSGRVSIKRDIAIFARRIEAGTVLSQSDIDWISVPDERVNSDSVTVLADAVGREIRHDAQEGQPVRARDLISPRLVLRGSLVTLKVQTPYLLITAQGRALQDGANGDVVRVTNTQSNRVVEGTVVAPGIVRVSTTLQHLASRAR